MRRFTLLLLASLLGVAAMAQQPKRVYCAIWGSKTSTVDGRVWIDYGQDDDKHNWLVDDKGNAKRYASLIHVMNELAEYDWQLEECYTGPTRWILSKEVISDEQITEGIYTRKMHKKRD